MKLYGHLTKEKMNEIFYKEPNYIDSNTDFEFLKYSLGATLYIPAVKKEFYKNILEYKNLLSVVLCLEDAINDSSLGKAQENLFYNLKKLRENKTKSIPKIFIRVRSPKHLLDIKDKIKDCRDMIMGFVFPKFSFKSAKLYFDALDIVIKESNKDFFCMPIFECDELIYKENRIDELKNLKSIIDKNKEKVLNIRVGGTDFSSNYSIRRPKELTIYDMLVVKDVLCDILNFFLRKEDDYVVSGAVFEYFSSGDRVMKPRIRQTPFINLLGQEGIIKRKQLIENSMDGLINEVIMDKYNGIIGKTIIHPTHIDIVNSLYIVNHEEYIDAISIINEKENGVLKSCYNNKMNEIKPHYNWAKKILKRAYVYGVFNKGIEYINLI